MSLDFRFPRHELLWFLSKLWVGKHLKSNGSKLVLCLHGFQDNCASFDGLIPLLDNNNTFLCFDFPNHGFSSATPFGVRWTIENYVMTIKRVVDHLKWSEFICIGHSMGGQIAKLFSAVYPEHVKKLIMIDTAGPVETYPNEIVLRTRRSLDELLKLENRILAGENFSPEYTYKDALERIKQRVYISESGETLNEKSGKMLLTRYLRPRPTGKHCLANNVRLKVTYSEFFSLEQYCDVVKNIKCPILLIRASESNVYFDNIYKVFIDMYKKKPNFLNVTVEGNHDVHMNHPNRVALIINKFLNCYKNKL